MTMTYEEYLDEITTLIYELYEVDEDDAVQMVLIAQDNEFFVKYDEQPETRTQAQAEIDAEVIYTARGKKIN